MSVQYFTNGHNSWKVDLEVGRVASWSFKNWLPLKDEKQLGKSLNFFGSARWQEHGYVPFEPKFNYVRHVGRRWRLSKSDVWLWEAGEWSHRPERPAEFRNPQGEFWPWAKEYVPEDGEQ